MRYERMETLLRLALRMQGSPGGLSLQDIQAELGVARRTAERMRDAVVDLFLGEEVETGERTKRWRIPPGTLDRLVRFRAEELAGLEGAAQALDREGMRDQAAALRAVSAKLRALQRPADARRVEPDLEALVEAEGLALRPGPQEAVRPGVLGRIREAILRGVKVRLHYRKREGGGRVRRTVGPCGVLYGSRHRLVAEGAEGLRQYVLSNIERVEVTEAPFERPAGFSLRAYAERSFGTYQEEEGPFHVVWRFTPEAARDARNFLFHPTQEAAEEPGGSLVVRFRACGLREMAWHLFTWGEGVEVVEPEALKEVLSDLKGR
ncbi:MAG: WYL domain-containing protein [Candidatus Tectomicrobia bacterium]|uniref:WYL domain-containing protein n=1 Tax=Tectimicrobiota bacterium TaxID=2528274 RepID=A0A932MM13_UNCTE|nr:WYL domain-containing protein [Candidatus Tectomicrobia bacterium]